MYSVLNTLSKYILLHIKKHYFIHFLLVFKIAEYLQCILKALSFLLAFEKMLDTCLTNFRSLSNVFSRKLTLSLSQTLSLSNFVHIYSFLFPDIKR